MLGQVGSILMDAFDGALSGEWTKAEASLTAAISALTARIASHSAEKEALENIVHEIKTRIADLKDMEKGVYTNPYVTVPGKIHYFGLYFSLYVGQVVRSPLDLELLVLLTPPRLLVCPLWELHEQNVLV